MSDIPTKTRRAVLAGLASAALFGAASGEVQDGRTMLGLGGGPMADGNAEDRVRYYAGPLSDRPDPGVKGRVWEVFDPGGPDNGLVSYDDGSQWVDYAEIPHDHAGDDIQPRSVAAGAQDGSYSYDDISLGGHSIAPPVTQYTGDASGAREFRLGFEPALVTVVNVTNNRFYFISDSTWAAAIVPNPGLLFTDTVSESAQCYLTSNGVVVGDGSDNHGNVDGESYKLFMSEGVPAAFTEA